MISKMIRWFVTASTAVLPFTASHAGIVDYTATQISGNVWRYDYTINNTTPSTPFDEVTIYFDVGMYNALSSPTAPSDWDPLLVQPDTGIPADGFFDVINLVGALPDGASVSGFSVTFNYLSQGTPGAQRFTLLDSASFTTVLEGLTSTPGPVVQVPEPSSLALLGIGLGLAAVGRRRGMTRVNRAVEAMHVGAGHARRTRLTTVGGMPQ